jgi:hypothetical protein
VIGANANRGRLLDGMPGPEVTAWVRVTQCFQPDPAALPIPPHPLPTERLDLPHQHRPAAGMDATPLDRPRTTTPTSTPASDASTPSGDSTAATNGNEHPQPHNGIRWSWPKSAPLQADKPGLDSMHFSTGTNH